MNNSKLCRILLLSIFLLSGILLILQNNVSQSFITLIYSQSTRNFDRRVNSTTTHGLIIPTFVHFNHVKIFDLVIHRHSNDSNMFSIFFSGCRNYWKWSKVDCFFHESNMFVSGLINLTNEEPFVLCPLPDKEQRLVLKANAKLLTSIYIHDSNILNSTFISPTVSVPIYAKREYNISIYTMIRDKTYELVEWIEYHLLLGIQHFYLYDHFSTDNLEFFLRTYLERDIVTIIRWWYEPLDGVEWNMIQTASMNHALKNFGPYNRWMGYFDVDEYFQIKNMTNFTLDSISLDTLLDQQFPESKYPGGVQFQACTVACRLTQADVLSSRYRILFEKCQHVNMQSDCRVPQKMFIRPRNVPLMFSIHELSYGMKYATDRESFSFGRFRHYHNGHIIFRSLQGSNFDQSMDIFIKTLRERVIKYRK